MTLQARFSKEVAAAGLPATPGRSDVVEEADLAALPEAVRRYLRFMGVVGRPRDASFRAAWRGSFRTRPEQKWMSCEAWQYDTRLEIARIFHIRIRFGGLVPALGRDTYVRGHGRMRVQLMGLFTVVDARGEELDTGELVTYLNDAILLAPSMILGPEAEWSAESNDAFAVSLTDHGRTVTAHVAIDEEGAPRDFVTTDRFVADPHDAAHPLVRAEWHTPIDRWTRIGDRIVPREGRAYWELPRGRFEYVRLEPIPGALAFNVPPANAV